MSRILVKLGAVIAFAGGILAYGSFNAMSFGFPIFAVGVAISLWGLSMGNWKGGVRSDTEAGRGNL